MNNWIAMVSVRRLLLVLSLIVLMPKASSAEAKEGLAILDFTYSGITEEQAGAYVDYISSAIVVTSKYRIINREAREQILEELEFSLSEIAEENRQLEIGKLVSASYIITGVIAVIDNEYYVTMKLVSVETSETVRLEKARYKSFKQMIEYSEYLALKLVSSEGEYQEISSRVDAAEKAREKQLERENREIERAAKRREAGDNIRATIGKIFHMDSTTWNIDIGCIYANGIYIVQTEEMKFVPQQADLFWLSAGIGYYLTNAICLTAVFGYAINNS